VFSLNNAHGGTCRVIAKVSDICEIENEMMQVMQLVKDRIKALRKLTTTKFEI